MHAREDGGGVTHVYNIRGIYVRRRARMAHWMDGGGETSRSTSAYSEPWMHRIQEQLRCYLLREAYVCALCVYLVYTQRVDGEGACGYTCWYRELAVKVYYAVGTES